jgi:hypothetical protein
MTAAQHMDTRWDVPVKPILGVAVFLATIAALLTVLAGVGFAFAVYWLG